MAVPVGNRLELEAAVVKVREEGEEGKGSTEKEKREEIIKKGKITDEEWKSKVFVVSDVVEVLQCAIELLGHEVTEKGEIKGKLE